MDDTARDMNGQYQHFVNYCLDHVDRVEKSEYRKEKIECIRKAWMTYKQKADPTTFPWKDASNTVLPLTTITMDNLEPRLVSNLTGKEPYVQFEMDGMTEQPEDIKVIEDFFNQELKHTVHIDAVARNLCKKAGLEGTVYPICAYEEDEVTRRDFQFMPVIDPMTGQPAIDPMTGEIIKGEIAFDPITGKPMTEDVMETIFSGGRVKYAAFNDVFVADDAETWEASDVVRRVYYTYGELMELKDKPGYMNIGPHLLKDENREYEKSEEQQSPDQDVDKAKVVGQELIECLECSMFYVLRTEDQEKEDITSWAAERYLALIARDSKILIRFIPLREVNFKNEHLIKRVRLYPEDGKAYGTSLYEKMKAIQHGSSDLFNMVINVATITIIPWFLYSEGAGFDGEAVITPGKGIKCDDPSQVVFPRFNQNPRSYMVFIEMFMSLWERLGSIGDLQVGRLSQTKKDVTATETMAAIQEGNIKHNYQGMSLKEDFMTVIRTLYDLYYQHMPHDKTFPYKGQEVRISRASMSRRIKFKLTGSTDLSNKVLNIQKAESRYQAMRQDPIINPVELLKDVIEAQDPDAQVERYIAPMVNELLAMVQQNPEIPQMLQQYMQQKQQAQMEQQQMQQQEQQANHAQQMGQAIVEAMMTAGQGQPQQQAGMA